MDSKGQDSNSNTMSDKELSDLLDNVTKEFSKLNHQVPEVDKVQKEDGNIVDSINRKENVKDEFDEKLPPFDVDYQQMFNTDPEFQETWSKLLKSCSEPMEANNDTFYNDLHKTLKSISDKAKDISGNENVIDEEEVAKLFLNLDENFDDNKEKDMFNLIPLMNSIMENLLSKDFLYPTLCDLCEKYPIYLKENKDKISEEEYQRYEKQLIILKEICAEFEKEVKTEKDKNETYRKVLKLMQTVQSYGTPPSNLVVVSDDNADVLKQFNQLNKEKACILM